jgi:two-component system cell cycle response regulator
MAGRGFLRVLIVEDNPAYARLVQETLRDAEPEGFAIETASLLSEAVTRLGRGGIDVVLMDLGLPDAKGADGFARISEQFPELPVVVLTGLDDEDMAMVVVSQGAQDYLVKGRAENDSLSRALRYAVERNRMQAELRQLAIVDELTGLHNRRGFITLAEHQLKLAGRRRAPVAVLYIDLDGMKAINDTHGHAAGDRALMDTADLLRRTLRASDVVARLGGDEFVALLADCEPPTAESVTERLQEAVRDHNGRSDRPYSLSLSVGTAELVPGNNVSVEALIEQADRAMYRHKAGRPRPMKPRSVTNRP